jgi:UDP-N-acetylmuramoyl-tripeptide--D-alanyl-D-alanine ligase
LSIPFSFIKEVLQEDALGNGFCDINHFCINSKESKSGCCFVGISGNRYDGGEFIREALLKGAVGLIVEKKHLEEYISNCSDYHKKTWCIGVSDVRKSLIKLASHWRLKFDIPFIGVTGSVGKTTTKELIGSILIKHKTHVPLVSFRSQNSILGLALTLLKLRSFHTVAVCEVGINNVGEMDVLACALKPDIAIITNVKNVHVSGLGSIKEIVKEKCILANYIRDNGVVVIDGDNEEISNRIKENNVIKFGVNKENDFRIIETRYFCDFSKNIIGIRTKSENFLSFGVKEVGFKLNSLSDGFSLCALAAIAASTTLNIPSDVIVNALEGFYPVSRRGNIIRFYSFDNFIVDNSWNANPASMNDAIVAFGRMNSSSKKMVVLGDMLELGDLEIDEHEKLLNSCIKEYAFLRDIVVIGKIFSSVAGRVNSDFEIAKFSNWCDSMDLITRRFLDGYSILIKGSRGMQLGKIVEALSNYVDVVFNGSLGISAYM